MTSERAALTCELPLLSCRVCLVQMKPETDAVHFAKFGIPDDAHAVIGDSTWSELISQVIQ